MSFVFRTRIPKLYNKLYFTEPCQTMPNKKKLSTMYLMSYILHACKMSVVNYRKQKVYQPI